VYHRDIQLDVVVLDVAAEALNELEVWRRASYRNLEFGQTLFKRLDHGGSLTNVAEPVGRERNDYVRSHLARDLIL
jgi:hypothetical protein